MSRLPKSYKSVRFNMELPTDTKEKILNLHRDLKADSMSEVIRKSIDVLELLVTAQKAGKKITVGNNEILLVP